MKKILEFFGFKKKKEALKEAVIDGLKQVFDPEIPVNIYDLGLIYDVDIDDDQHVHIQMTLTSPLMKEILFTKQQQ